MVFLRYFLNFFSHMRAQRDAEGKTEGHGCDATRIEQSAQQKEAVLCAAPCPLPQGFIGVYLRASAANFRI